MKKTLDKMCGLWARLWKAEGRMQTVDERPQTVKGDETSSTLTGYSGTGTKHGAPFTSRGSPSNVHRALSTALVAAHPHGDEGAKRGR